MKSTDFKIIKLPEVDSTNSYASLLLKNGKVEDMTVIMTDFQKSGKGQSGNSWESEKGKNMLVSIICFPAQLAAETYFYISMITSLAIVDLLSGLKINSKIKWPNDIYIKKSKTGGILIENIIRKEKIKTAIIGIGLNVNQTIFPDNIPDPASLKMLTNRTLDIQEQLRSLLGKFNYWLNILNENEKQLIKRKYLESLYLYNTRAMFGIGKGNIEGRIIDVKDNGQLVLLDMENNIHFYNFKEISFPKE